MKVFLYEHLCALAGDPEPPEMPASWLVEGRAMRNALEEDFRAIPECEVIVADNSDLETLLDNALACDWTLLVAPETDATLLGLVESVQEGGGRPLSPHRWIVCQTGNKEVAWERLSGVVPMPGPPAGFPQVWKPKDGCGSQDTFLVRNGEEAKALEQAGFGHLLKTEYVPGIAASVAFLVGPNQILPLQPCRQILSDDGRFRYLGGETLVDPDLARRAVAVALPAIEWLNAKYPFVGYVGCDVVLGERDVLIEVNPRVTTSYIGLRKATDANLAKAMIDVAEGRSVEIAWRREALRFAPGGDS